MLAREVEAGTARDDRPAPGSDYETYFTTGFYEARYPAPNPATLRTVLDLIRGRPARVLDFGCGNGRYTVPLLARTQATLVACDTCPAALARLDRRLGDRDDGRLLAVRSAEEVAALVGQGGPLDLALLLFGVLGHVAGRENRVRLLADLGRLLRPDGAMVVSVPNRRRRFRAEQARCRALIAKGDLEPGDVRYTRRPPGGPEIRMFYHLYEEGELEAELAAAGLRAVRLVAESVLPEPQVVRGRLPALADGALRRVLPLGLAYGFLAIAVPARAGEG